MNARKYKNKVMRFVLTLIVSAITINIHAQPYIENQSEEETKKLFKKQIAPLLEGMGEHNFVIATEDSMAQAYFNQAVALTYGFNHYEAGRSYQQVAILDKNVPMAYWGQALVLGPNINAGMDPEMVIPAHTFIQQAVDRKEYASEKERDLIDALATRYSKDETMGDRSELDQAYAKAMRKVAAKYPEDPNIQTLLAEALMVLHPWDYWYSDGRPRAWTPEILEVIESALEQHPHHAGLIHYYIHAVEASKNPGRALKEADTLGSLIPGAGHIVHMPSHIYIRTGRYHQGVLANEKAIKVDDKYITQCHQQGIYPLGYAPHNHHFLWAMATLEGNSEKAIMAAEHLGRHTDQELMRLPGLGTLQHYWVTPVYAYVRFGKWDKILSLEKPADDLKYPLGVWHYARGIAFAGKGELEKAKEELDFLKEISSDEEVKKITVWEINNASEVLGIARLALEGEIAGKENKYDRAVRAFRKAVELEDNLNYNEPSDWHYPVRQSLGAVLLEANRFEEAEKVYRQDLEVFPENGWSLFGLHQSLVEQGKMQEAEYVKTRLEEAWKWADFELEASRVL